jgi:hypothetical protein
MPQNSFLTISGLTGTQTPDGNVTIGGVSSSWIGYEATGTTEVGAWAQSDGVLTFRLEQDAVGQVGERVLC